MTTRKDPRLDQADFFPNDADPAVAAVIAQASARPPETPGRTDDEKIHIFWRVFGGAILSMVALTAITLYNSLQSGITELRGEQAKLNELRGDFVRKDEFNTRIAANYDRIGTLQTQNSTQNAAVVSLKTEIDGVKERLAKSATEIEGVKKDLATIEVVKERLTALAAELKLAREESMKAKADVEKNLLADQERKAQRDTQYKDLEKAIKDLQTTLQECQVKLARIEGQQQAKPAEKAKDAP